MRQQCKFNRFFSKENIRIHRILFHGMDILIVLQILTHACETWVCMHRCTRRDTIAKGVVAKSRRDRACEGYKSRMGGDLSVSAIAKIKTQSLPEQKFADLEATQFMAMAMYFLAC